MIFAFDFRLNIILKSNLNTGENQIIIIITMNVEGLFNGYVKILSTPVKLHREIENDDIRVVYTWRGIAVVDVKDLSSQAVNQYIDLYRIPKTVVDTWFKLSHYSSVLAVYPYIGYKTMEEMANEPIRNIRASNRFIAESMHQILLIKLSLNGGSGLTLDYWIRESVIEAVENGSREPYSCLLKELAEHSQKLYLTEKCTKELQNIMNIQTQKIPDCQKYDSSLHLKENVKLYDYQMDDINWMNMIREKVDAGGSFQITCPMVCKVIGSRLAIYNSTLLPAGLISDKAIYTKNVTFKGGALISEVGLGKTLVCLHHIFDLGHANRAGYNRFVTPKPGCNYCYKRGSRKGESCGRECGNDFFCKTHNDTLFVDKLALDYVNLDGFKMSDFMIEQRFRTNSSLVICPPHVCDQWIREYYSKFRNDKRVVMIANKDQYSNLTVGDILFSDLVVISYSFLNQCILMNITAQNDTEDPLKALQSKSFALNSFHWNAVFLDEAHEIQRPKIIDELTSDYKWNVTGTPFADGLNGFMNLVAINTSVKGSVSTLSSMISAGLDDNLIDKMSFLFKRNTKESVSIELDKNVINEAVHRIAFTQMERNIYDSYAGNKGNIDTLIRLCCHPELYNDTKILIQNCKTLSQIQETLLTFNKDRMETLANKLQRFQNDLLRLMSESLADPENETLKVDIGNTKRKITMTKDTLGNVTRTYNYLKCAIESLENENESCPICLDGIPNESLAITKCGHKYCWDCIYQTHLISAGGNIKSLTCPTCKTSLGSGDIFLLKKEGNQVSGEIMDIINQVKSSKLGHIIHFLKTTTGRANKVIIFSQWDELLHKVGDILTTCGLGLVYCDGSVYSRTRAIKQFCTKDDVQIIMLSSKNAASGINLTCANTIILLEPVYGDEEYRKNIENQAIGRADRIGQLNSIDVHRFIIQETIEEDIINGTVTARPAV